MGPADPSVPPPDCGNTTLEYKLLTIDPEDIERLKGVTRFVGGELFIRNLLAGLEPLDLACVEGSLSISGPEGLRALSKLQSVTDTLRIGRGTLTDLTGLDALRSVGSLIIEQNESLTSLRGLSQLTRAEKDFAVLSNLNLRSLVGLERLAYVGGQIRVVAQLFDGFDPLVGLGHLGGIQLEYVPGRPRLGGLHFIQEMSGSIQLHEVDIVDLQGLERIKRISSGLLVESCPQIQSLDGLGATDMGGSIDVRGNPLLTNIDALKQLRSFSGQSISFESNSKLEQCDVMSFDSYLRDELAWKGTLMSGGNAATCAP